MMGNYTFIAIILLWLLKIPLGHMEQEALHTKRNILPVHKYENEENEFIETITAQRFFMFEYSLGNRTSGKYLYNFQNCI